MASIIDDSSQFAGADSSGYKLTRYIRVEATDSLDASYILPEIGDAHPGDARYQCESIGRPVFNEAGTKWFGFEIQYKIPSSSGSGYKNVKNVPPWELGPQNFQSVYEDYEGEQIKKLYVPEEKKWIPYVNGAGSPIIRMKKGSIRRISFDVHKEFKGKFNTKAAKELLNPVDYKVCGISIPAYCGLLLPMSSDLHTVYENDGSTIKWQYETLHFIIRINPNSWKIKDLNVGRLAKFPTGEDGKLETGPIFQYTPWTSTNPETNAKIRPKFGSIADVMAAQAQYSKVSPTGKIPYTQFDEDLPLKEDGTLYLDAIEDPVEYPYLTIEGYESEGSSWNGLGIPKEMK